MATMSLAEATRLLNGERTGMDAEFSAISTDSRRLQPGELFVALQGPTFDGHDFVAMARQRQACGALVSRLLAIDLPQIRVADTRLALGQLAAAWRERFFNGPLLALTGSNGKTTVKEMLTAILGGRGKVLATSGNLNNDIGMPLTLLRLKEEHDYAVIEMGANHAGEIAYLTALARPDVAIVNNAAPAHLEGFGDLDGVAWAKGEIFQGLGPAGIAIINRDDPYADCWRGLAKGRRIIDFGLDPRAKVSGEVLSDSPNCFRLSVADRAVEIALPLPGRHNVGNALAAAAASLAVGATLDDIRRGLEGVRAVTGRLQSLPGLHGATLINDTYNANPASLAAALSAVGSAGRAWLVLGDMAELGPKAGDLHEQAGHQARTAGFERLYALGGYSQRAVLAFGRGGSHFQTAEALIHALTEALAKTPVKPTLLIKGSRGMRMERIVQALLAEQEAQP